jgi:hypothetical protein
MVEERSSRPGAQSYPAEEPQFVTRHLVAVAVSLLVFIGTVLRMWDSLADADSVGEFAPRTTREELHRLRLLFTPLGRFAEASTSDRKLYYLRVAQGWFFLSLGAFGGVVLAVSR